LSPAHTPFADGPHAVMDQALFTIQETFLRSMASKFGAIGGYQLVKSAHHSLVSYPGIFFIDPANCVFDVLQHIQVTFRDVHVPNLRPMRTIRGRATSDRDSLEAGLFHAQATESTKILARGESNKPLPLSSCRDLSGGSIDATRPP